MGPGLCHLVLLYVAFLSHAESRLRLNRLLHRATINGADARRVVS